MLIGSILFMFGFATAILYFLLFYRTIKSAGSEADRYVKEFLGRRKIDWIVPVLVVAALIVENLILAIVLMAVALTWGAYATFVQNKRMKELDFGPLFRRRLIQISCLVPIAILLFLAGQILRDIQGG